MDMLLDSKSYRLIGLMEVLLVTKKEYIVMHDLSKELKVSLKTIQSDLNDLLTYANENFDIKMTQKGLKRGSVTVSEVLHIQADIIRKNKSVLFIEEIFFTPHQSLSYYAKTLGCSRTFLTNQIVAINQYLKKYRIELKNEQNGFYFFSKDELFLRKFFAQFFLELAGFKGKVEEELFDFVKLYFENKITIQELRYYSYYTYFSILREHQGFNLVLLDFIKKEAYEQVQSQVKLEEEKGKIKSFYENIIHYYPNLSYESLIEVCSSLELDILKTDEENIMLTKKKETQIASLILKKLRIYDFLEHQYAINNIVKTFYIRYSYLKIKEVPIDVVLPRFAYFEYIAIKNSSKITKIKEAIEEMSELIGLNLNNSYSLYLVLIEIPELLNEGRKLKILVVSNNSLTHGNYMKDNIIKYQYINRDNIDVVTTKKVLRVDTFQYDLVITNNKHIKVKSKHLFVTDDFITDDSMFNLRKIIDKIEHKSFCQ